MPQVLNIKKVGRVPGAVYIGRPSKWGNPFTIGPDGTRKDVIRKHRSKMLSRPDKIKEVQQELRGKDLLCFCAPSPCHGDTLLELANAVCPDCGGALDYSEEGWVRCAEPGTCTYTKEWEL